MLRLGDDDKKRPHTAAFAVCGPVDSLAQLI
jgi:hypothetical protein